MFVCTDIKVEDDTDTNTMKATLTFNYQFSIDYIDLEFIIEPSSEFSKPFEKVNWEKEGF